MKRSRRRSGGFFSDPRRRVLLVVAAGVALALLLVLIRVLARSRTPEEPAPNPVATITMRDGGQMRFELYPDEAPNTVANFVKLANDGFYDGLQFFKVVAGVFIQGGDPNNNGTGDPGYAIKGEFAENGVKNDISHMRGVISMARTSGYDTAGSQFFIMQGSYPEYDGRYAAFGMIMDGESLNTLDAIAAQPVDSNYLPLTRQVISSIRVDTYEVEYEPVTLDRDEVKKK